MEFHLRLSAFICGKKNIHKEVRVLSILKSQSKID